ncbi:MAG: hypothetical protein OXE77_01630 [Flavobacteriaceae bacterium]|nr:hypothetical protein [Flavobacteriaceae bacterium]MCY4267919.1 hypothetical protein [Flavobacteriaceae bacterium]MCY4298832.1 hypothetical protein [Flavobacteriaceae bacterium]
MDLCLKMSFGDLWLQDAMLFRARWFGTHIEPLMFWAAVLTAFLVQWLCVGMPMDGLFSVSPSDADL